MQSEGHRRTFLRMDELFPQIKDGYCRVCQADIPARKQSYCSDYCKTIAQNVQKLFSWGFIRDIVAARDEECVRCGSSDEYEIDHIVPVSNGGHPFDPENMQRLCVPCHEEKGLDEADFRENGSGGVRLFPGNSASQLTLDGFEGDADSVSSDENDE